MGTITFSVAETGFSTATKNYSIPDAQVDRMIAAYQVAANASVNATASRGQVLSYIADQVVKGTIPAYVLGIEQQNATATALASITPITPT